MYYPDDPEALEAAMRSFGLVKGDENSGKAPAIIAPHGAWNLSGPAAAAAFKTCRGQNPSRVVLLGMMHGGGRAGIFLSNSDSFHTPLGGLPVDRSACEDLASCSTIIERRYPPSAGTFA
jgi:AmmeMemoRadiSam system protein B